MSCVTVLVGGGSFWFGAISILLCPVLYCKYMLKLNAFYQSNSTRKPSWCILTFQRYTKPQDMTDPLHHVTSHHIIWRQWCDIVESRHVTSESCDITHTDPHTYKHTRTRTRTNTPTHKHSVYVPSSFSTHSVPLRGIKTRAGSRLKVSTQLFFTL